MKADGPRLDGAATCCKGYRLTLLSLSPSLYLTDYTRLQYATLLLPYYYHASTVPPLVGLSFPFPSFIIS